MKTERAISISDLRRLAKRRLPKVLFEAIESGVEDEVCLTRNENAFRRHTFNPRHLVDVSERDLRVSILGAEFSAPFGIAPMGIAGVFRRDAELRLAEAAADANVPFVISGASMASIEQLARISPHSTWYQVYPARDASITQDQIKRAADAGCSSLVLTVDNPVLPKRERDMRNGMGMPFRPPFILRLEALLHSAWIFEYLRGGGMPTMRSWAPYVSAGATAAEVATFFRRQSPTPITWRDLERFRRMWPRSLIVKGITHPDDAMRCVEAGANAIVVSNHGGKVLDRAPAPLEALPAVAAALRNRVPVILDGGIRRGSDVVMARCAGAAFVLIGRAALYGVVAGGEAGVRHAIRILKDEIDLTLALIGCPVFKEADGRFLLAGENVHPSEQREAAE